MSQSKSPPIASIHADKSLWGRLSALLARPAVALGALVAIAAALRLYKLTYYDFYDDEIISAFASRRSPLEMITSLADYSVHPPLFYMLLHYWSLLGTDLVILRLLSVLISLLCVPLVYLLGRELAGRPVGLVTAGIMALSPFQIFHAQQARMYPLLTLVVLVTVLLFLRAWRRGGWRNWAWFGLSAAAGLYTHVYFPFSLVGLTLWALLDSLRQHRFDRARWGGLLGAQVLAALAFVPFLPQMLHIVGGVSQWFWIGTSSPFYIIAVLVAVGNYATGMVTNAALGIQAAVFTVSVTALLLALLYSVRQMRRHPNERPAWLLLHLLIWTPLVIAVVVSYTVRPILLDRSLSGVAGPLYVLMGWMLVRGWRILPVRGLALAFVLISVVGLSIYFPDSPRRNSIIQLADHLAANQQPGDALVFTDWQGFETFAWFYPQEQDVFILPASGESGALWSSKAEWEQRIAYIGWGTPDQVQPVQDFAPEYQRVWLVLTSYNPNLRYHQQNDQQWLETHGQLVQQLDYGRAVVYLYEIAP